MWSRHQTPPSQVTQREGDAALAVPAARPAAQAAPRSLRRALLTPQVNYYRVTLSLRQETLGAACGATAAGKGADIRPKRLSQVSVLGWDTSTSTSTSTSTITWRRSFGRREGSFASLGVPCISRKMGAFCCLSVCGGGGGGGARLTATAVVGWAVDAGAEPTRDVAQQDGGAAVMPQVADRLPLLVPLV